MDYLQRFKTLSEVIFKGRDLKLAGEFIEERRFSDLYLLVKACKEEESAKEIFAGELVEYLTLLGEDISSDIEEEIEEYEEY